MSTVRPRKPRVAVVFGGRSSEHAVSCAAQRRCCGRSTATPTTSCPIGIAKDGRWVLVPRRPGRARARARAHPRGRRVGRRGARADQSTDRPRPARAHAGRGAIVLGDVDVVFPLLHGPWGEDGTMQGMLDLADVRYVGSGVHASAARMDKHYMKVVFAGHGLPVGPYAVITDRAWRADRGAAIDAVLVDGLPGLRQARSGRVEHGHHPGGLTRRTRGGDRGGPRARPQGARRGGDLRSRARVRRPRGPWPRAAAHERTSARSGSSGATTSTTSRRSTSPTPTSSWSARPTCPTTSSARCGAWRPRRSTALGCEGLARVDCFYTDDGEVLLNEINTMPGFTPHSMYPRMWAADRRPLPELVDELIALALARRVGLR
jgi:D-alanine-D-alanine ligase